MPALLKRLELNGFKSFAQKTVFEFPAGITAIVGPNGSGKSNIIDAIRWLLGEREAKSLRGVKAEDLIFAGTAKKARVGQAQASLHFDNHSNFFPVEFSEVTVTREVSRDGANRYSLNKSEIRLKDLVDFFARARLGTKGLVVITQGNSDLFIRSAPKERREMIEEMLGLREYQLKRAEAERRLNHTQLNLDKVKALTEEILPHLRSLKRQTGRWEKREAVEEELRSLENELYGREWHELEAGMKRVEHELREHEGKKGELEREKKQAEKHLEETEAGAPKAREELKSVRQSLQELFSKRAELEKQISRLEARLEAEESASPVSFPEAGKLRSALERAKERLTEVLSESWEMMRDVIEEVLEEIEHVLGNETERAHVSRAPSSTKEIEAIRRNLEGILHDIREKEKKAADLEGGQEEFHKVFKDAMIRLEAAKERIEEWQARHAAHGFEKERIVLRREELLRQIHQAGRRPEEFTVPAGERTDDRDAMEKRMFRLRGELMAIGEVDEALVKEARETEERFEFLKRESEDLTKAKSDLEKLIDELSMKIATEFKGALESINEEFKKFFELMFGGGHAKLKISNLKSKNSKPEKEEIEQSGQESGMPPSAQIKDEIKVEVEEEKNEEGIEIELKLPRKRITALDMLSGGERSLVGIAALFALISVSPPPFLVLDEVDAALDERNARRFAEMLKEFAKKTQFILVTHNRATMEAADVLYGITMNEDGTSKVVSLKLEPQAVQ